LQLQRQWRANTGLVGACATIDLVGIVAKLRRQSAAGGTTTVANSVTIAARVPAAPGPPEQVASQNPHNALATLDRGATGVQNLETIQPRRRQNSGAISVIWPGCRHK
jgi:hypothetical protein